jgi:hypothetical protein
MAEIASVTQRGKVEPFELQVARGQIAWHYPINIFGYQSAVPTGTPIAVWENASAYVFPTVAQQMLVYSSSASDTNCRIVISGLDANFAQISEAVILTNGTTGVSTTKSFYRIHSVFATDATYTLPVGTIKVAKSDKSVTYGQVNIGIGRSQMSVYTVPAGYTFYLMRVDVYISEAGGGSNYGNYRVSVKDNVSGNVFLILQSPFALNYNARRVIPFPYTEKMDIQWQASVGTSTAPVGVIIEGVLIKNDGA